MRKVGLPIDTVTVRGLVVGYVTQFAPSLFEKLDKAGKPKFRCNENFIRLFMKQTLDWSFRRSTRAAQKIPQNSDHLLNRAFLRMACLVRDESVASCFIVNADQTQNVYNPGSKTTWTESGVKQVAIVGLEEKRAFTLLVGPSNSGEVLPFQAIYQGKDPRRSLHKPSSPGYQEAIDFRFRFEVSEKDTYWSTQKTMRSYVTNILVPYFNKHKARLNLPNQQCIFQIDVWSVHRSTEFTGWMAATYPWITLTFVPGG